MKKSRRHHTPGMWEPYCVIIYTDRTNDDIDHMLEYDNMEEAVAAFVTVCHGYADRLVVLQRVPELEEVV